MTDLHHLVGKQINRWNRERDTVERLIKEHEIDAASRPSELKPVVTISRQRGCRGREFAKLLAHDLHYGMLDHSIIEYIAQHLGVRSEVVELLDERDRSDLELWCQEMFSGHVFHHDDYIRELGEVVKSAALHGGVVIVGRGANYFLKESHVYRLRLVASEAARVDNLVKMEGMSPDHARNEIARVDEGRAHFVKRYFKKDIDEASDYDLTINLATNSLDAAVKTVVSALRARGWSVEQTGGDRRARQPISSS